MACRARNDRSCLSSDGTPDGSLRGHARGRRVVALMAVRAFGLSGAAEAGDKEPSPAVKVAKIGSLVIVGGGPLPSKIQERFVELPGGAKARLVVIPTASQKAVAGKLE